MTQVAATRVTGMVNLLVTSALMAGIAFVIVGSARRWIGLFKGGRPSAVAAQ
jgi:hypothetical protein